MFPASGAPDFHKAVRPRRQDDVYAFDLLHRDGHDLRPLPLIERLERFLARSQVACLRLAETFDDGLELLETVNRLGLEGVVSTIQSGLVPTAT